MEYVSLNVTIPRLDDQRKSNYKSKVVKYTNSGGQLMCIDDVTGEEVKCITEDGARMLRAAAMDADRVPVASMLPIGLELVTLQPGERAILPVKWDKCSGAKITECSTHPERLPGWWFHQDLVVHAKK